MNFGRHPKNTDKHYLILAVVGTVMCTATLLFSVGNTKGGDITLPVSTEYTEEQEDTAAEPFGYFRGSWNLWEFIGDSVASLVSGL